MRVGYAKVSTVDQNPELQLEALKQQGCEKVFVERGSGARDDRPELRRVLEDVLRSGDTLVVWKLDRLARSLRKLITTAEDLEKRGVGLVSLTESIDTTTPGGVLIFHVFGAIAQFERALIRERTAAGLQEARRQGRKGGARPPRRYPGCPRLDEARQSAGTGCRQAHGRVGGDTLSSSGEVSRQSGSLGICRSGPWLSGASVRPVRPLSIFVGGCLC
ncbi:Resolvase domain-containing protein [Rhizobium sp. PDO1-076]|nr:Resolvase domain-containing protein [Rhizobium sp. PDO1-076]